MKTEREKQLEINLLVEKIERISKKKVTFKEVTSPDYKPNKKLVSLYEKLDNICEEIDEWFNDNDLSRGNQSHGAAVANLDYRAKEKVSDSWEWEKIHKLGKEYDELYEEIESMEKEKKSFKESLKRNILKEGTWTLPNNKEEFDEAESLFNQLVELKIQFEVLVGDDELSDGLHSALVRARELLKLSKSKLPTENTSIGKTNVNEGVYQTTKKQLDEIKSCIPDLNDFYNKNINGDTLYSIIVKKTPTLQSEGLGYVEFVKQINDSKKFDISWTLPKSSSGSFYTAFTDLDWVYEVEGLTSKEAEKLINDFKL